MQTFLYKLLCDKFAHEIKQASPALAQTDDWIKAWQVMPKSKQADLHDSLPPETPQLSADQLIPSLFNRMNEPGFAKLFDDTLIAIAVANSDIFAIKTDDGERVPLFDRLSEYVTGSAEKKDAFVRALFNKLVGVSFEAMFAQKYDFWAALFEYLIKDYNKAVSYTHLDVYKRQPRLLHRIARLRRSHSCMARLAWVGRVDGEHRMSIFNEDSRVKIPALLHLARLGYSYLPLKSAQWDPRNNIFPELFAEAVLRINPDMRRDEVPGLLDELQLKLAGDDLGRSLHQRITARTGVRLIDFDNLAYNSWHVVTELPFINGEDEFRPDITLLLNGMPLAFVEVKKPMNAGGVLEERRRMDRRHTNPKFRHFFNLVQLMAFSNNMELSLIHI